jgi:hypothetical protein
MLSSVNARPLGAMTSAPAFTHRLARGNVGGDHDVARPGPFGNPIVGGVHAGAGSDPVDQRSCGTRMNPQRRP